MDNHDRQLTDALHHRLAGQLHNEISGNLFAIRVGLFNVISALDPTQDLLRLELQKNMNIVQITMESVAAVIEGLSMPSDS